MLFPEALKKELNNSPFLGREVIFICPGCFKVLILVTINSELFSLGLPKRSCAQRPEELEVDKFKVMEGLLIKKEYIPIDVSPKGQPTYGQTTAIGARVKRKKKVSREGGTPRNS